MFKTKNAPWNISNYKPIPRVCYCRSAISQHRSPQPPPPRHYSRPHFYDRASPLLEALVTEVRRYDVCVHTTSPIGLGLDLKNSASQNDYFTEQKCILPTHRYKLRVNYYDNLKENKHFERSPPAEMNWTGYRYLDSTVAMTGWEGQPPRAPHQGYAAKKK